MQFVFEARWVFNNEIMQSTFSNVCAPYVLGTQIQYTLWFTL